MRPHDSRRFRQFQLRQLFSLTAIAALAFAVLAPSFRKLDLEDQLSALWQTLIVMAAVVLITMYLLNRRLTVERRAGMLIERFERRSSRLWTWFAAALFVTAYAATIWVEHLDPSREFDIIPGSPMLLFIGVNFLVIRVWWKIDPTGIEACEHGLILGGLNFTAWPDINRYSWSGSPARQLNLFLKTRNVLNIAIDSTFVESLDKVLQEHRTDHSGANVEKDTST